MATYTLKTDTDGDDTFEREYELPRVQAVRVDPNQPALTSNITGQDEDGAGVLSLQGQQMDIVIEFVMFTLVST